MKNSIFALAAFVLLQSASCEKDKDDKVTCNLPSTQVPASMAGNWANGYNSSTQLIDTYNGQYLGNAWQSGKYFHFQNDGRYAEFYYMVNSGLSTSSATKATGTVTFNEAEGTFQFHCCKAHFKGWQNGVMTVDRDATEAEVAGILANKLYYSFETIGGVTWMEIRFDPQGTPTSFRSVN